MKAFVINMDRDVNRMPNVVRTLSRFGFDPLNITRLPAVDGKQVKSGGRLKGGELGCTMSHHGVWRKAFSEGYDMVAIFEDDIVSYMTDGMPTVMDAIKRLPPFDILYLGKCNDRCDLYERNPIPNVYQTYAPSCAHAYIVTRRFLQKMLDGSLRQTDPLSLSVIVDDKLQHLISNKHLTAYTYHPSIFIQDIINYKSSLRGFEASVANVTECITQFPFKKWLVVAILAILAWFLIRHVTSTKK